MSSIQALRAERNEFAQQLHNLMDKTPSDKWAEEHTQQYDDLMAKIDAKAAEIDRVERYLNAMADQAIDEQIAGAAERLAHDQKKPELAVFAKWLRGGDNALTPEDWATVQNTTSTTTGSEGGYTVQTEIVSSIMDAMKAYGGMRAVATIIQTTSGNPMSYPTSDGTSETGEQIAENTTATAADPVFGTIGLNVYKYSSKVVAVPFELIQDSNTDIEAFVSKRLTQRIGRITNTKFTLGTGTNEPKGIVTAAASGKVGTTGQTTTITFEDLVDLVHSVDPAYRASPACQFMMNDDSMRVIRKLKDTNGRPIFMPGFDGLGKPMPDTVLGYSVQTNQDVPVMAASAKSILFGDFSHYVIRDVMAAAMFRFTDSAYTKLGQVGFLMWSRHGGTFTDVGGAVKYYQNSAT